MMGLPLMSYYSTRNFLLDVDLGNVAGHFTLNKSGVAPSMASGVFSDIWEGTGGLPVNQPTWLEPTAARIHVLVSDNAQDGVAGTGALQVRVFGLETWDSKETVEDVILNGTTGVPTVRSYVMINRLKCNSFGTTSGTNVGIITATADVDGTITAAILAGQGQSHAAIHGIPSTQTMHLLSTGARVFVTMGNPSAMALVHGFAKENADQADAGYITTTPSQLTQSAPLNTVLETPLRLDGPAILKARGNPATPNVEMTASFGGVIVDN